MNLEDMSGELAKQLFSLRIDELEEFQGLSFIARGMYYKLRTRGKSHNEAFGVASAFDRRSPRFTSEFGFLRGDKRRKDDKRIE